MDFEELKREVDNLCTLVNEQIDGARDELKIENKILKEAIKEQIPLQIRWGSMVGTLTGFLEYAKMYTEMYYAEAFRDAMTNDDRSWSTTEAKVVAQTNPKYIEAKKLENKVFLTKNEAVEVLRAIETRKYLLKDTTNLVIASCEDYII